MAGGKGVQQVRWGWEGGGELLYKHMSGQHTQARVLLQGQGELNHQLLKQV